MRIFLQKNGIHLASYRGRSILPLCLVNYPPLARAEVGASGLRPSFFLPVLHRQAPVFHRLFLICRIFSKKSNLMRIFLQKMEFIEERELARSRLVLSLQGEVSSRHL